MIPELGQFSLILAFSLSILLGTVPIIGAETNNFLWMSLARPLSAGVFVFLAIALVLLAYSFVTDDFSVQIVAAQSNSLLPMRYKLTALWGGHEGSFLLWTFMLAGWMLAVSMYSKSMPTQFVARVLGVLGILCVCYILFMLATSNPFERITPLPPADGSDLNTALQDFGFIVHPPTLYMGYVGFSVVFAFAIAALLSGRLDSAWARWSRPWANAAWAILTIGIALGSWWAYYELGWGGWWAWDPVENPPLITWLLASDPTRGVFILGILLLTVGGALLLYALRAPLMKSELGFTLVSREIFLLTNNVLLVVSAASIFLGTLFPMVYQALTDDLISIGPPYFNAVFVPLMIILMLFLGVGPMSRWKKTSTEYLVKQVSRVVVVSLMIGVVLPLIILLEFSLAATVCVALASWIVLTIGKDLTNKIANKASVWSGLYALPLSYVGMMLAHTGIAVMLIGAGLTSYFSLERSVLLGPGEKVEIGSYAYIFNGHEEIRGPNYVGNRANISVLKNGNEIETLFPERRIYLATGTPSTEMAIDAGFLRDLFVTLGEQKEGGAWSMTVYVKPFIRWIWLGAIFMALGGIIAAADKRYRLLRRREQENYEKKKAPSDLQVAS